MPSPSAASAARATTTPSLYLVVDARTAPSECSSAAGTLAGAVWCQLLSFIHCQALLGVTSSSGSDDWSVLAMYDHDSSSAEQPSRLIEWLVPRPLSVGSLRYLSQRWHRPPYCSTSATQPQPTLSTAAPASLDRAQSAPDDAPSELEPVLLALEQIMQRRLQEAQSSPCSPSQSQSQSLSQSQSGRGAAHIVLLSPHLLSPLFVGDAPLFLHSLSTMGGSEFGCSFRLLHLRCTDELPALPPPLLDSLRDKPYIRLSGHSGCITSSACHQPQHAWSIAASLPSLQPLYATLLFSAATQRSMPSEDDQQTQSELDGTNSAVWHELFDDQGDAGAASEFGTGSGDSNGLSIPVMLLPAVRTLPLPVNTQVCGHPGCRSSTLPVTSSNRRRPLQQPQHQPTDTATTNSTSATVTPAATTAVCTSCTHCGNVRSGIVLLGWRRADLSSLLDTFDPLRDTCGSAVQVVANKGGQQDAAAEWQLSALLRQLQQDRQTMLFRVDRAADGLCRCHWPAPTSAIFALHAARDLSACWLLPHVTAEQSVLCSELYDERSMHEASSAAAMAEATQSIRFALLRLPLTAGPFNSVLYSSGWSECVTSILDRATKVTNTTAGPTRTAAASKDERSELNRDQLGPPHSAATQAERASPTTAGRSLLDSAPNVDSGEWLEGREDSEDDSLCEGSGNSAGPARRSGRDSDEAEESSARVKSKRSKSQRRHGRAHSADDDNEDTDDAQESEDGAECSERNRAAASRKSGSAARRGRNNGNRRKTRQKSRDREGDSREEERGSTSTQADNDDADDWKLDSSNAQLDAEVALLVTQGSGRRGSLRLHHKREKQREQEEEAKKRIQLMEDIAAKRFRERMAANQQQQQLMQEDAQDGDSKSEERPRHGMEVESEPAALSSLCALPTSGVLTAPQQTTDRTDSEPNSAPQLTPPLEPKTASHVQQQHAPLDLAWRALQYQSHRTRTGDRRRGDGRRERPVARIEQQQQQPVQPSGRVVSAEW